MAANSLGGSVVTLPLYFASNSCARLSASARVVSMAGSVGDLKRSLRSQRTFSAPVILVAWAIGRSEYRDVASPLCGEGVVITASRTRRGARGPATGRR